MQKTAEFKEKDLVRIGLEVDEDLEFEGSVLEDGIKLSIDPDSLKAHVFEHIEHPSTVIHEHFLALGYDVHYKTIQRLRREMLQAVEESEFGPIPSFADMVLEGKKKMKPEKLGEPIPISGTFQFPDSGKVLPEKESDEDLPEDELVEIVRLVREAVELAETDKI